MSWLVKSLIALLCLVPIMLAIGFFERNFKVRPEVTAVWYFGGTAAGIALAMVWFGSMRVQEFAPRPPVLAIAIIGLTLGAALNGLLFQAVPKAPNPSLPFAIVNSATVVVFLLAPMLVVMAPKYFPSAQLNLRHLVGVILATIGAFLLAR